MFSVVPDMLTMLVAYLQPVHQLVLFRVHHNPALIRSGLQVKV